jgi:hypothetical protein
MDDQLLASHEWEKCWKGTKALLAQLSGIGYKDSWKRPKFASKRPDTSGSSSLKDNVPSVQRENRPSAPSHSQRQKGRSKNSGERLDSAASGYLDKLHKGPSKLGSRPRKDLPGHRLLTVGLPDVTQPFNHFVCEKNHTAMGILTLMVGPWQWPVVYLLKHLDLVASGWPPCLCTLAATVALIREADKLTLEQDINIRVPHADMALMNGQGHKG